MAVLNMFNFTELALSKYIKIFTFNRIIQTPNAFEFIKKIIKFFTSDNELFFVNYRVDGFNVSCKNMNEYRIEIPHFFSSQGECCCLNSFNRKSRKFGEGLTVCRCTNNDVAYDVIEKVFHYFRETIVFSSRLSWNLFVEFSEDYMKHRAQDYIINGFTDVLFLYADSGDFSIIFDTRVFSSEYVHNQIDLMGKELSRDQSGDGSVIGP
ncbi:hypothetical protein [Methanobrevibacter sp.]